MLQGVDPVSQIQEPTAEWTDQRILRVPRGLSVVERGKEQIIIDDRLYNHHAGGNFVDALAAVGALDDGASGQNCL